MINHSIVMSITTDIASPVERAWQVMSDPERWQVPVSA